MRGGVICLALALGGPALAAPFGAAAEEPGVAAAGDSAAIANVDSAAAAAADRALVTAAGAAPAADSAAVASSRARAARAPWTELMAPGDTLVFERNEVERTGAHFPLELLAFMPGAYALSASGIVPFGAVTWSGSFSMPELKSDGWSIRLPRLEGRDLSRMLLDRLGPGPTMVPMAAPGDFQLADRGGSGVTPAVHWSPAEPIADSAQSRIAAYYGDGLSGGGLTFSDQRGPIHYGFGFDNSGADRSGSVDGSSTRLAMIDAGGDTPWGRINLSLRGTETDVDFLNGRQLKHDDQGVAVEAVLDQAPGPAWSLRLDLLDDRLNGNEFPEHEFKRKAVLLQSRWTAGRFSRAWLGLVGERDRFQIRGPGEAFEPLVLRGRIEVGGRLGGGSPTEEHGGQGGQQEQQQGQPAWQRGWREGRQQLHFGLALRASDRHPPRSSGQIELEMKLPQALRLGVGASRDLRAPTFDQEVLVRGRPVAEPERHDAATVRLDRQGPLGAGILVARRHLAHLPVVVGDSASALTPEFEFATRANEHWEIRGVLSTPPGPYGLELGAWGSRFAMVAGELPAFVPEGVGRAYVALRFDFLDDDLVLRPRIDGLWVGESRDFEGGGVADHGQLDATLVAIVGRQMDLEIRMRNALNHHYRLPVIDPATDQLYLDSGRVTTVGLRWRLAN